MPENPTRKDQSHSPTRLLSRNLSDVSASSPSTSPTTPSPFKSFTASRSNRKSGGTPEPAPMDQHSPTSSVSGGRGALANATLRRRSSIANANATSPTRSFTSANGTQSPASSSTAFSSASRHRASSLLTRVSPSLANSPARFSSSAATVGLRAGLTSPTPSTAPTSPRVGERELGLGIDYSRGHGALPSPPTTASDATSTGSGLTGANSGSQSGSVGSASGRAELPPPATTPTMRRFQVPTIEKSSPTVAGNSPRSARASPSGSKRYSLQSSTSSTGTAVAPIRRGNSLRHSASIEPLNLTSSNHRPTSSLTLPTSPDVNSSESDAATLTHLSDDLESPTRAKGKERERSNSGEGEDSEVRRARRARRNAEAKERNQRILDNINSTIAPLASPPPSSNGSSPRRRPDTVRRQSNVTTMRSLHLSEDRDRPSSASGVFNSPRLRTRESTDEFGLSSLASGSVRRRSSTLGKDKDESERARRVRTLGHRGLGDGPERSYSSLSSYPVTEAGGGTRASRIDWLDREYDKRASTSAGGEREREIEKSLRKLSSNERILLLAQGGESDDNRERELSAGARPRPSLPLEFVQPGSARSGSPQLPSPRVTSPALRERRTDSPTSLTPRRDSVSRASSGRPGSFSRPKKASTGSGSTSSGILPYHADALESERASLARQRSLARLRTQSLAEPLQRSDTLRSERDDVFQNGLRTLDDDRRRQSQQQMSPSIRSGGRYAADRHDRSRSTIEVGSDAWLEEYQDLQQRGHHSRASGSSGDALSSREVPQTPIERDRTIRAISALLSEQNITPGDLASIGLPQTAPAKLGSTRFDSDSLRRRKSSATEGRVSSPSPYNATVARSKSAMSNAFPRSAPATPGSDHPKLLQQAFEYFDAHFSPTEGRDALAPDSVDLVKRMSAMVQSTTKLNAGLRALVTASTEAQIEAELDENSRTPAPAAPFEKSLNALLRTSDDQVRSLTEGLIAFTRVERERDKLRRDGNEVNTRPASRATFRSPGAALQMSPKRPATSSPFEGATVSTSASRPSTAAARLRDPLDEPDLPTRRATQSFSVRSPRSPFLTGYDSPTPSGSGRRDATAIRSPLSGYERPSTPSRAVGGLPVPPSLDTEQPPQAGIRRSKSSANSGTTNATARPPTPGSRLPRSPSMIPVTALLDSTVAQAGLSPTRSSQVSFPRANGFRALSETSPRPGLDALGLDAERDAERETWRHTLSSSRSTTFQPSETEGSETSASSSAGRGPRQRLSTGSVNLGQALRSLVRGRRNTNEAVPPEALVPPPLPDTPTHSASSIGSPDDRKAARRQEVEAILRRTGRAGRQSMG